MRRSLFNCLFAFAALAALVTSGCGGTKPSRFYMLQSAQDVEEYSGAGSGKDVVLFGLMPVALPDYVRRPQIVTHVGEHEMEYADYDRWAEPLVDNLTRVIVGSVREQLDGVLFINYPWVANVEIDYRLHLEFDQFDIYDDGNAILVASWALGVGRGGEWRRYGYARLVETFEEDKKADYTARVAALNRLVDRLSEKLSTDITAFIESQPAP